MNDNYELFMNYKLIKRAREVFNFPALALMSFAEDEARLGHLSLNSFFYNFIWNEW